MSYKHSLPAQEDILAPFFALRDAELERQRSHDNQQHSDLLASLQRWRGVLRFFTGERGAWSSRWVWSFHLRKMYIEDLVCRSPEQFLWRLNRSENFSRMRLKLSRDYTAGRHRDASRLRDLGSVPYQQLVSEPDTALLSLIKVSSRYHPNPTLNCPIFTTVLSWQPYPQVTDAGRGRGSGAISGG